MGEILVFEKVKLVIGVLYSGFEGESVAKSRFDSVLALLTQEFGEPDLVSHEMLFSFTHYYDEEMQPPIYKRLISFKQLIDPQELSAIKIRTNQQEEECQVALQSASQGDGLEESLGDGRRPVNLDPGILDLSHLILATTKNRGHRFPLLDGIYGELTLLYMNGDFQGQPWTYDDFNTREYKDILLQIRELYRPQRRALLRGEII